MKCTICKKEIVLVPSARERARKDTSGNSASYYTRLFTEHNACAIEKRNKDTADLIARHYE